MKTFLMDQNIDPLTAALWTTLAGMGGIVRFVGQALVKDEKHTLRSFVLLAGANCFVSGFSGLMGALLVSQMTSNPTLNFIAAGIFGYLGIQGLETITRLFKQKMIDGIK